MKDIICKIQESKDTEVYKLLVKTFSDYTTKYSGSNFSDFVDKLLVDGLKVIPRDKKALAILEFALTITGTVTGAVQKFMNLKFSDLPTDVRPVFKNGTKLSTAYWKDNGVVIELVKGLLKTGKGKGVWCDETGKPVKLIDLDTEVKLYFN